jgi:hypothetical protein
MNDVIAPEDFADPVSSDLSIRNRLKLIIGLLNDVLVRTMASVNLASTYSQVLVPFLELSGKMDDVMSGCISRTTVRDILDRLAEAVEEGPSPIDGMLAMNPNLSEAAEAFSMDAIPTLTGNLCELEEVIRTIDYLLESDEVRNFREVVQ